VKIKIFYNKEKYIKHIIENHFIELLLMNFSFFIYIEHLKIKIRIILFIFFLTYFFYLFVVFIDKLFSFAQLFIFQHVLVVFTFNLIYFLIISHFIIHFSGSKLIHCLHLDVSQQIYTLSKYLNKK
jgi:hypothetical protein